MSFKYRADQLGSLLRPADVLKPDGGKADEATVDRAILRVLERQKAAGLKIFTDGEFRRRHFMSDFNDAVEGLDDDDLVARTWKGGAGQATRVSGIATQKIRPVRRLAKHEMDFMKRHSPGDIKITLPSANQFPAIAWKKEVSGHVYPTPSDFLWDVVPIIKREIDALVAEGARYIQIDAPRYSYFIDPKWREYLRSEMRLDPDRALDEAVKADNACIADARGKGAVLSIHLCRGNNRSKWYADGGYDPIAEKVFNGLDVDAFSLEYETERAGTFEPLRHMPKGKAVILGLLSSKLPALESADEVRRRIDDAAKFVALDDLALSTQCGFASSMEGNLLSEDEQWRKLERVVDIAERVWGTA